MIEYFLYGHPFLTALEMFLTVLEMFLTVLEMFLTVLKMPSLSDRSVISR